MTISNKSIAESAQTTNSNPNNWLEEYGDSLYRRALLLLGKSEAAEDLVQDTLLAAYQAKEGFRGQASIKTWLHTILKNKAIDYMRKAVRREIPTVFEERNDREDSDFNSWGIWKDHQTKWGIWDRSAQEDLESQGLSDVLINCIEKLPNSQRSVLKLKVFEDMPIEEVCKELDLKPSNLGVLLFRARLALRNCLDTNWYTKI